MISDARLMAQVNGEDEDMPILRSLEEAAIAAIQKQTGRYFGPVAQVTEYLSWRGWPMQLANEPVGGTLTSFKSWDGSTFSTVDATTYYLQGSFIFWNSNTAPNRLTMPTRYQVVYNAGYAGEELLLEFEGNPLVFSGDPLVFDTSDDPDVWAAPKDIQQAVLLIVGHWFRNRESVGQSQQELPWAATALLDPHTKVAV